MATSKKAHLVHRGATITPWIFYALAWLLTFYLMYKGASFWNSYLRSVVLFNGGFQGIWTSIGHLMLPKEAANNIGWKPSAFQTEIGAANLAIGITSVVSYLMPTWLAPVALIIAIFYAGCVYVHVKDRLLNNNKAPCNSGPMLYNTILVSASLFIALIAR
jgi:hypothetical protein